MAHKEPSRVRERSTTTGTGAYSLAGAALGCRTFNDALDDADTVDYVAVMDGNYEVGRGTYSAGTLARTHIYKSSNSDNAVDWVAGTKDVIATRAGLSDLDATGLSNLGGLLPPGTIPDEAVTNAKLAHMAQATVKGRASGAGTGDATDLSASQLRAIANVEDGADVTDATNVAAAGAVMESDTSTADMDFVVDEDDMSSDSATKVPTQQSVKAYVDAQVSGGGYTDEEAQDAVGNILTDSAEIDFTYNDGDSPPTITASLKSGSIDEAKLDASVNASLDLADTAVQPTEVRERLTANRTYYVRADGSDSNTGLVDSSGGAFLTIQKAIDTVAKNLDLAGFAVTIQVGAGTYTGAVSAAIPFIGGTVTILGDTTTPSNVLLNVAGVAITADLNTCIRLSGLKIQTSAGTAGLRAQRGAEIRIVGNMEFGACNNGHMEAEGYGKIIIQSNYSITGASGRHWWCESLGFIDCVGRTITITGTPAFSTAFAYAFGGFIYAPINTFSGSATGARYTVVKNGTINTNAAGATYLPGDSGGSTGSDGVYD